MARCRYSLLIFLFLIAAAAVPCAGAQARRETLRRFTVVAFNDWYRIEGVQERRRGGAARLGTVLARLRARGPVLALFAGDLLSPSLMSREFGGVQMVEALNAAGAVVATFGNHEFDAKGPEGLLSALKASRFRWISGNVVRQDGRPFPGVPARLLRTVGGVRVGVFGLTVSSQRRKWVNYRTGLPGIARREAAALRRAGAEVVIALTHLPMRTDRTLARAVPGIDFIVGGHEHHAQIEEVNGRTLILKADSDLRTVWLLEVAVGLAGAVRRKPRLIALDEHVPRDPKLLALEDRWVRRLARRLGPDERVGESAVPLDGRGATVRFRESNLGNLIADAVREGAKCDVAAVNGGAIRIDDVIPAGPITRHKVEEMFLFRNRVSRLRLRDGVLREVFAHAAGRRGSGGFLQLSGARVVYAAPGAAGTPLREARVSGASLEGGRSYVFCTNDFLARGGDGYAMLPARGKVLRADAGDPKEMLIRYLRRRGRVAPRVEGRIRFVPE